MAPYQGGIMRPIVAVMAVSLCLWGGMVWTVLALTDEFAPSFIPGAQHKLHATLVVAETHLLTRIAYYRSRFRFPV